AVMSATATSLSPVLAGVRCRCPRCGRGALFAGPFTLSIRDRCEACGLELKFVDSGDGPAVFAILVLGVIVLGAALIVEFKFAPPFWLHLLLWPPVTLAIAFALLRPLKATLIALQYAHKAEEGRIAER